MKNVLIIGKNSYLGISLIRWLDNYPDEYSVNIISARNNMWKKIDFSEYDAVVDFAGIAHINNITTDMESLFYSINKDLTIEIGKKAKDEGVRHFIYFSSMNVYGDYCSNIVNRDAVNPTSFYGDSKLQGEIGLQAMEDETFIVSRIRPPFVYGKGCKGNYNTISKIAKIMPIFPSYSNKKSMIYIDNLCEFVRILIDSRDGGCFTPQNKELVSTADLVREIAKQSGKKIWFTKIFNWAIPIGIKLTKVVRRAFADDCYTMKLSDYDGYKYCIVDFEASIKETES